MNETAKSQAPEMPDPLELDFEDAKESKDTRQLLGIYHELYSETFASWQALDSDDLPDKLIAAIEAAFKGSPTPITNEDLGIRIPDDISLST